MASKMANPEEEMSEKHHKRLFFKKKHGETVVPQPSEKEDKENIFEEEEDVEEVKKNGFAKFRDSLKLKKKGKQDSAQKEPLVKNLCKDWICFLDAGKEWNHVTGKGVYDFFRHFLPREQIFEINISDNIIAGNQYWQMHPEFKICVVGDSATFNRVSQVFCSNTIDHHPQRFFIIPLGHDDDIPRSLLWQTKSPTDSHLKHMFHNLDKKMEVVNTDVWEVTIAPIVNYDVGRDEEVEETWEEVSNEENILEPDDLEKRQFEKEQALEEKEEMKKKPRKQKKKKQEEEKKEKKVKPEVKWSNDRKKKFVQNINKKETNMKWNAHLAKEEEKILNTVFGYDSELEEEEAKKPLPNCKSLLVNNFMSIGVDFFRQQGSDLVPIESDYLNEHFVEEEWYNEDAFTAVTSRNEPINKSIEIWLDTRKLKIPNEIEGIAISNMPISIGSKAWGEIENKPFSTPKIDDVKFEIIGFEGLGHFSAVQAGLRHGIRLGQGSQLEIMNTIAQPCIIDGDPFVLVPSKVLMKHKGQLKMFLNTSQKDWKLQEEKLVENLHALEIESVG